MFFNIFQCKYIRPSTTVQPINSVSISNSVPFGKQFGTLNCGHNGTELHKLLQIIHLYVMVVLERCYGGIAWRRRRKRRIMRRIMPCRLSCLRPNIILRRIANIHVVWTSTMHEFLFEGVWNRSETGLKQYGSNKSCRRGRPTTHAMRTSNRRRQRQASQQENRATWILDRSAPERPGNPKASTRWARSMMAPNHVVAHTSTKSSF